MPKKNGRPTAYRVKFNEQAFKLCLLGATDAEMADIFGVSFQTLNTWKKKHPKFLESIKAGKDEADANVASRLYERAMGYVLKEKLNLEGKEVEKTKETPPDTSAAIFWLKNRRSGQWRDKQHVEHSGSVTMEEALQRELDASTD